MVSLAQSGRDDRDLETSRDGEVQQIRLYSDGTKTEVVFEEEERMSKTCAMQSTWRHSNHNPSLLQSEQAI